MASGFASVQRVVAASALTLLGLLLCSSSAYAQATRTWVSGVGDDANPGSRTAPVKTFAGAISKTAAGGEISVLDPGGFGAVTVTKAMTLNGAGTLASILHSGTNGVVVNAGTTDVVILRNLHFHGGAQSLAGVRILQAGTVIIEDCYFDVMGHEAIQVAAAAAVKVILNNVHIRLAGRGGLDSPSDPTRYQAIFVSGSSTLLAKRLTLASNVVGVHAEGSAQVTLVDSILSDHSIALRAIGNAVINGERLTISNNSSGTATADQGLIRLSDSMTAFNDTALDGNVLSFGNNRISAGNTADGTPANTLPLQ